MNDLANSVMGILGDYIEGKSYKEKSNNFEELEKYLLNFAKNFESEDLAEKWKGEIIISDKASKKYQKIIDDYNDIIFWEELAERMGKRDFERTITVEDEKYLNENNGWLPDRIHTIYNKYHKEFENNGIDRLEIIDK